MSYYYHRETPFGNDIGGGGSGRGGGYTYQTNIWSSYVPSTSYLPPCPFMSDNSFTNRSLVVGTNPSYREISSYSNINNNDEEVDDEDDDDEEDDDDDEDDDSNDCEEKGSVAFFTTYRTPVPMDIYSTTIKPKSSKEEYCMSDGKSYNYNGCDIPPGALKNLLKYTKMGSRARPGDVDAGTVTGLLFVSERTNNLETLHFALRIDGKKTQVFNFAQLYGTFDEVRMEDSGCFAADRYLIYVSTMQRNSKRRQPWTAVYRTDLCYGTTVRLTPPGEVDFSPSVSPSGKQVAVASLQASGEWKGEIEHLKTDIYVMDVNNPNRRKMVIKDGGWPSWGSDDVIYFHRATLRAGPDAKEYYKWGVFRSQIRNDGKVRTSAYPMTPVDVDAMTPAAIDEYRVAVAIIRERLDLAKPRTSANHYRHIEVFDSRSPKSVPITQKLLAMADHYNPFVISSIIDDDDDDDEVLIGYHCCINKQLQKGEVASDNFDMIQSKDEDNLEVFRVPGVFPTFTRDGRKLAFVDNDFQHVYLADIEGGLRVIFSVDSLQLPDDEKNVFSPVWSQHPEDDILLICVGPPFSAAKQVHIYAIHDASSNDRDVIKLTQGGRSNNAFPSTNPDGTKIVYRSTKDWVNIEYKCPIRPKNLYIIDWKSKKSTRITKGDWSDTHCQWSPNGQWIVFSSTRDKPANAPPLDHGLDPGYYSIYLLKANDPNVVVRVVSSGSLGAGHVNHPMFSPDGNSIVFAADLAGVSVEPISLPLFLHSVRPYGDIFSVNINNNNISANKDIKSFNRVTHSRFENSTPSWSLFSTRRMITSAWIKLLKECLKKTWHCPFAAGGAQNWECTGHLGLKKRCC